MNEMQVFQNEEFGQLRTVVIDEIPWAVGKDVAMALGYKNTKDALTRHVDEEDRMGSRNTTPPITDSMGRVQYPIIINESGLYSLILSSKLPSAKRFKRWVTSEVLPALRKTGTYSVPTATQAQRTLTTDDYIRAASIISTCRNERLPYVLNLLSQGGIDIPLVAKIASNRDESGECAKLINRAIDDYGMGTREIGRLTGLAATQIQRIRTGASIPTIERATMIAAAIKNAVPEIE